MWCKCSNCLTCDGGSGADFCRNSSRIVLVYMYEHNKIKRHVLCSKQKDKQNLSQSMCYTYINASLENHDPTY